MYTQDKNIPLNSLILPVPLVYLCMNRFPIKRRVKTVPNLQPYMFLKEFLPSLSPCILDCSKAACTSLSLGDLTVPGQRAKQMFPQAVLFSFQIIHCYSSPAACSPKMPQFQLRRTYRRKYINYIVYIYIKYIKICKRQEWYGWRYGESLANWCAYRHVQWDSRGQSFSPLQVHVAEFWLLSALLPSLP